MRKGLVLIVLGLLTICTFFSLVFLKVPLGEPRLKIEFYPLPPWQVRFGEPLEISIGIANDGWPLAWAKNIHAIVLLPEGFTSSRTGTNECELDFFTLHGGDGLGNGLTIIVSSNVKPGNYTITIKVSGENVLEKVFAPEVIVIP